MLSMNHFIGYLPYKWKGEVSRFDQKIVLNLNF